MKTSVRLLLVASLFLVPLTTTGCTKARPDPRENPNFNEEAYNDPDAAMKAMQGPDQPK